MIKNTDHIIEPQLEERVKELARCLLFMRKMQDKAHGQLLSLLGNLSMPEIKVLNVIGDHEPFIMSNIAKSTSLSLSSITVIVDKLVKLNLVKRVRSDKDRRIVSGCLTPEGKKIYQIQIEHLYGVLRKLLNGLTMDEQNNFLTIFQKITQNWG